MRTFCEVSPLNLKTKDNKLCIDLNFCIFFLQGNEFEDLLKEISRREIKALFIDECHFDNTIKVHHIKEVSTSVQMIWLTLTNAMVINSDDRDFESKVVNELQIEKGFAHIKLSKNLRNSKSIVQETLTLKKMAEFYSKGYYAMTPWNFPAGCAPQHFESLKEAINRWP